MPSPLSQNMHFQKCLTNAWFNKKLCKFNIHYPVKHKSSKIGDIYRTAFKLTKDQFVHNTLGFNQYVLVNLKRLHHHCPKKYPPWKILFYGTDEFSLQSLKVLNENRLKKHVTDQAVEQLEVVCSQKNTPVHQYATKNNLVVHWWPFAVPPGVFDVGVVVSFGHLIPQQAIQSCHYGMVNVHASLLPRWRGAAPIIHTVLNGDTETGVTIMQLSPKCFDIGRILLQQKIEIPHKATSKELYALLAPLGAQLLIKCLTRLPYYLDNSVPQPKSGVTYAPKVHPSIGIVLWEKSCCEHVDYQYRALNGITYLFTYWQGQKVKLLDKVDQSEIVDAKLHILVPHEVTPGTCYFHKKRRIMCIKCKDGWVGFRTFFIYGRKKMSADDFYNGFLSKVSCEKWVVKSEEPT
ncbi:methionyl-tRNA formyltransferase, mitochondrial-like [Limulus polyphemus]|uniref:Methionyl-tRNA formyltransferase, mitochondrial n=1 Tax=Limulus polyphemus TaxID=6850 RepID=A0ABM1S0H1_LIMPO|nr:methionyl-tRNA formyltransferase, mitochondrial-like [Limulus polyphemus]